MSNIQSPPITKAKDMADFKKINSELNKRGFIAIDALRPGIVRSLTLGDRDPSDCKAQDMAVGMGCGNLSNGPLAKVAWSFDSRENQPLVVSGPDNKPLGNGYIPWGPGDNLPSVIYSLAKASPYTAAPLRYLADLATGLGVRLMYQFEDETMCEFKNAGYNILLRIEQIKKNEEQATYGGDMMQDPVSRQIVPIASVEPESRPDPILNGIGMDYWKDAYKEWQRTWEGEDVTDPDGVERHIPGVREFLENNDLDLHLSQCMQDDVMFDLFFPTVGFERGRRGVWDPRIVKIGFLPIIAGIRYEVCNEYRHINNIYFGEKWRLKGLTNVTTTGTDLQSVKMYPACMPQNRVADLRYLVSSNQRTRIKDRPTWVACPVFYGNKQYYQQPAWWSIFPIKAYDFSSTILYDKAKQRENRTSWGKIIYISLDYLDMMFADEGIQGDKDKQQQFIDELDQRVEEFLQHRENNGKMMRQFMWLGQDGKDHHNVGIVDVADVTNDEAKAGKEELELSTNPIFLAFGVDPRDVGVPMVTASNGGTALREIRLMKQQLLNVRQRAYIAFIRSVCQFNRWDRHIEPVIRQQTFSTLDRSKTGTVDTIAGQGA
jgi:hypothetical protein